MLTHEEICKAVSEIATEFPIKQVSYFGSYAEGRQTDESDLDLLMEFQRPGVSLFMLLAIKERFGRFIEDSCRRDSIHAPVPQNSLLEIGKVVRVYANSKNSQ